MKIIDGFKRVICIYWQKYPLHPATICKPHCKECVCNCYSKCYAFYILERRSKMIHKNRGNRRWTDKRKRRSKYNLVQRIWGDASTYMKGILGKYDKNGINDTEKFRKTNSREAAKDRVKGHGLGNNYSISDKRKVERCNSQLKEFESEDNCAWVCTVQKGGTNG